jgi:ABC-type maltose transport system permease subunit
VATPGRTPVGSALPISPESQSIQTVAKASWIAVLIPIPVPLALQSALADAGPNAWMLNLVSVAVTVGCCVIGLAAGTYALSKVRSVGREGVLTPALIGTVLNALFLGMMVVAFLGGMRR